MTQSTPPPWVAEHALIEPDLGPIAYIQAVTPIGKVPCCVAIAAGPTVEVAQANAALIVRAVNSHEKLLAACKEGLAVCDGSRAMNSREIIASAIAAAEPPKSELDALIEKHESC